MGTIGIIGGGALGTLFASRLGAGGAVVRLLVRSEARRNLLARDLPSVETCEDPRALREAAFVLVCVKAYHTAEVAEALARSGLRGCAVVSLQNGWGNLETLAGALPDLPLLAGATSLGAYLDDRGALHATDRGETLIAPWRRDDAPAAERLAECLRGAGLKAETRPEARPVLWRKLVLNSAVNPVTALVRRENGALLRDPPVLAIAVRAAEEAARVGWNLELLDPDFDPDASLRRILEETAENRSSMLEDLLHGRRTEVESITGAVVRLARETAEPAPVQEALLTLVRAAERP